MKPEGEWIFVDVGFSSERKSTGYLHLSVADWDPGKGLFEEDWSLGKGKLYRMAQNLTFAEACRKVQEGANCGSDLLHLVLEAPLSCAFNEQGNPAPRCVEETTRRWYVQPGPVVTMAALFLLGQLKCVQGSREIAIFEGFASFKRKGTTSDHRKDVCSLAAAIQANGQVLDMNSTELSFLGAPLGVPPVILAHPLAQDVA